MPRGCKKSDLPKACQELKEKLGDDVTSDSIGSKDLAALRNRAAGAMKHHLSVHSPEKLGEFKRLKTDQQRREWLAEYFLDPESGGCVGKNITTRTNEGCEGETEVWVTEEELAGPMHMNSARLAGIAIKSMDSRPRENEALRAAGVLQYKRVTKKTTNKRKLTESAGVEQQCALSAEDYANIKNHMADDRNPGRTKPAPKSSSKKAAKTAASSKDTEPEQSARKELADAAQKSWNALKTTWDKLHADLAAVGLIQVRLKAKAYNTEAMVAYLESETKKMSEWNDTLFEFWLKGKDFVCSLSSRSDDEVKTFTTSNENSVKDVASKFKVFTKEVLSEFSKIK